MKKNDRLLDPPSLMYLFRISKQAISEIIPATCNAIVEVLQDQVMVRQF